MRIMRRKDNGSVILTLREFINPDDKLPDAFAILLSGYDKDVSSKLIPQIGWFINKYEEINIRGEILSELNII